MCLGVNAIDLVLNRNFRKLGCHWRRWLGVFIASNHFLAFGWVCWRWAHRTVRWCTGHPLFIVRCVPRQHARWSLERLDRWNLCPVATLDSLMPHQTCPVHSDFSALNFDAHCSLCSRPLAPYYRCSVGSPDMSGAHQTVWWNVAERAPKKPESVRCTTSSTLLSPLLQIKLSPQLEFFLGLCWTLCTWDKWHLGKLVSPHGLWWTSTTKIDYRKWLSPFPFQSHPFWWLMPTQTKASIKCKTVTSLQLWLMCIGYLELNQLKDFVHMSKNKRDCFLLFNILDHICTTCLFLQTFWKNFSNSFANSQRYKNMISRSILKIWKFLPLFQMLFLWLNESSPWRSSPLSFQEGFWNDFLFLK
jgi:hypothetical protein